jgi:hypothetical protein
MYNQDYDAFQGCTAVKGWVVFNPPGYASGGGGDACSGSPSPGTVCADGTVYAGLTPDGNAKMYTTPADAPGTYVWATTNTDTAVVNCSNGTQTGCTKGKANQAILAGLGSVYPAAAYCASLTTGGHSDWYWPASNELNVLYTNRVAIGGFASSYYWSSSERTAGQAWSQHFPDGLEGGYDGKTLNFDRIRCVRQ